MPAHDLRIRLELPEDGPNLDELRRMAKRLGIGFDAFLSRAAILLHETSESEFAGVRRGFPKTTRDEGTRAAPILEEEWEKGVAERLDDAYAAARATADLVPKD
jgi:hypothetical protein